MRNKSYLIHSISVLFITCAIVVALALSTTSTAGLRKRSKSHWDARKGGKAIKPFVTFTF